MAPHRAGDVIAGCRVDGVIGRGGMGVVYRGTELALDRPVAIKLIAADRAGDASARRRFEREARMMASIDHPNVIPLYAAGEQDGALYLIMRFVDGIDLQQRLRERGRLEAAEAAEVIDGVARALDAAHARGLVHRDIKPANVLLADGHVYLTDFGITRLADEPSHTTETGGWVGTLDFTSPEHLRGEPTDARSDVYSLGCLLYTCLIGTPPFQRTSHAATIAAHLDERPPSVIAARPGLPRGLDQVIGRALAKRPAHRFRTAGDLAAAALDAAAGRPPRWRGTPRPAVRPTPQRRPGIVPVTAGAEPATRALGSEAAPTRPLAPAGAPTLVLERDRSRASARRGARSRRRVRVPLTGAAVAAVLVAALILLGAPGHRPRPVRPFTRAQVAGVAAAFARAYGRRDLRELARLLAPAVVRVTPVAREAGAAAVLADYRRQFSTRPLPRGDQLSGLVSSGGWVGRIAGSYAVRLQGGTGIVGSVVLAVTHVGTRPAIALIATQETGPDSPVSRPQFG